MKPLKIILLLASLTFLFCVGFGNESLDVDFRSYYCASRALISNQDPYSLATFQDACRDSLSSFLLPANSPQAPFLPYLYPPFFLVFLSPLAILAWPVAEIAWHIFNLLVVLVAVRLFHLGRCLTLFPISFAMCALFLPLAVSNALGQTGALGILSLALLCNFARLGAQWALTVGFVLLLVKLHLAIPLLLTLTFVLLSPSNRSSLISVVVVLGGFSLIAEYSKPGVSQAYLHQMLAYASLHSFGVSNNLVGVFNQYLDSEVWRFVPLLCSVPFIIALNKFRCSRSSPDLFGQKYPKWRHISSLSPNYILTLAALSMVVAPHCWKQDLAPLALVGPFLLERCYSSSSRAPRLLLCLYLLILLGVWSFSTLNVWILDLAWLAPSLLLILVFLLIYDNVYDEPAACSDEFDLPSQYRQSV